MAFRIDCAHHHEAETNEDAGHVARDEQGCNRHATARDRVDDQDITRRNEQAGSCRRRSDLYGF